MAWQESDLQSQLAVELDRSTTAPAATSSDYLARRASLDRANRDWAESYEWSSLLKVHNGLISTSSANASYVLPLDLKKIDSPIRVGGYTSPMLVVNSSDNGRYLDSDNYVNILGNENTGQIMFIHTNSGLGSGASVQFTYFSQVTSLSTTTSVSPCPDPTYLVQRALYYVYKAKEDGRFPEARSESDKILARMIENENTLGKGYVNRTIQVPSVGGFRIGRD